MGRDHSVHLECTTFRRGLTCKGRMGRDHTVHLERTIHSGADGKRSHAVCTLNVLGLHSWAVGRDHSVHLERILHSGADGKRSQCAP